MRCEVVYTRNDTDGRAKKILHELNTLISPHIENVSVADVYLFSAQQPAAELIVPLLYDPVAQTVHVDSCSAETAGPWSCLVEVACKPGVTDPVVVTLSRLAEEISEELAGSTIQTARQYRILFTPGTAVDLHRLEGYFYNPLIEHAVVISRADWEAGRRPPAGYPTVLTSPPAPVQTFPIAGMDEPALQELSRRRLLALSVEEMKALQRHFSKEETREERRLYGLSEDITDVELEMIAQTWSEHCKHKILNADIRYTENGRSEVIHGLFPSYIAAATRELEKHKPFLASVFHDNSGVIRFDEDTCVCFKVETHNSPSALDPYGGAITGIVGVNRDILGTGKGARPIFNTDVLCFGNPDTPPSEVPPSLLHPSRVLAGVHRGIVDGGNQSGIPTVGGALLFDESYLGKPLVFCGTGGILPAKIRGEESWIKHIDPGDLAVMVGGRIGKDGIHGATFSSLELSESSPTSAVQIGDPITQKKMADFLLEARDLGLYKGITDNGAGGLSSSLGEMAEESGGIRIDLDACPLKYSGLSAWEILVSESQERMSLSADPARIDELLALAARRDVEAAVVGLFTDTENVEVLSGGKTVALLPLSFLHHGLPVMHLEAEWTPPDRPASAGLPEEPLRDMLLAVLADPNVRSGETLIRQYDHEVQGGSVQKPFVGVEADGPSDGAVLRITPAGKRGLTVTCGICPRYGDLDTYHMAACAVDEAFRAHIALGGRIDFAAALDNFCWPDPVQSDRVTDGRYKLAQLVRSCRGLKDACIAYGLPLISGKDSMKNDAVAGDLRISVRPTLLVSLMGVIDDVAASVSSDFKAGGDLVYLLGPSRGELGGSALERVMNRPLSGCPEVHFDEALRLYRALSGCIRDGLIRSCHDLSEGGLAVSAAESCLGGRLGARIDLDAAPLPEGFTLTAAELLFCESPSRFLVSLHRDNAAIVEERLRGLFFGQVGGVDSSGTLSFYHGDTEVLALSLTETEAAWKNL